MTGRVKRCVGRAWWESASRRREPYSMTQRPAPRYDRASKSDRKMEQKERPRAANIYCYTGRPVGLRKEGSGLAP
jgi:hypothetical protein